MPLRLGVVLLVELVDVLVLVEPKTVLPRTYLVLLAAARVFAVPPALLLDVQVGRTDPLVGQV